MTLIDAAIVIGVGLAIGFIIVFVGGFYSLHRMTRNEVVAAEEINAELLAALEDIAKPDGVVGGIAMEYKLIARAALAKSRHTAQVREELRAVIAKAQGT